VPSRRTDWFVPLHAPAGGCNAVAAGNYCARKDTSVSNTAMKNNVEQLAVRVSAEFEEMPGMSLTMSQAQRLWCLDGDTCAEVVALLVARAVLRYQADTITLARRSAA